MIVIKGIQDDELSPNSDWIWLTPIERIGIQSRQDAEIARRIIEERKNREQQYRSKSSL
jgi:hypothetical protein